MYIYIYIYIYTYPVCYKERVCVCVLCPERISLEGIVPAYPEFTMMFVLGGNGPVYAEVTVLLIRKQRSVNAKVTVSHIHVIGMASYRYALIYIRT
jgi:hypothetical protein